MPVVLALREWVDANLHFFQFFASIIGIMIGPLSILWARHVIKRERKRLLEEYRQLENNDLLVVEGHYLRWNDEHTKIVLEVEPWGGKHPLAKFDDPILQQKLEEQARLRSGFIKLDPQGQHLLRAGIRDLVVGNDWAANHASIDGRPVHKSMVITAPVTWRGVREVHLIRVVVLSKTWVDIFVQNEKLFAIIEAFDSDYSYRIQWLRDIVIAWKAEQSKPPNEACVWALPLRSVA